MVRARRLREPAASVGAGLATAYPPIATFRLEELIAEINAEPAATSEDGDAAGADVAAVLEPHTIGEVLDWARKHIATLSGVRMEAIKLDCRIET